MNPLVNPFQSARVYQVLYPRKKRSRGGHTYLAFQISDGDCSVTAHAWEGQYQGPDTLVHGQSVYITGRWVKFNGQDLLQCRTLSTATAAPDALHKAHTHARLMLHRLNTPLLHAFVLKVFEDEALLQAFLSLPASTGYHHGYKGGLFIHSVETAWTVYRNPALAGLDKDIAIIGALLHDIGKVNSYTPEGTLTAHGRHVDHDAESLLVLHPALQWLERQNKQLALQLKHCLSWNPKKRPVPLHPGALQVRFADQASTVAEVQRGKSSLGQVS